MRLQFWSSKGIMDSVPKVKGIITPKTSGFKTKCLPNDTTQCGS